MASQPTYVLRGGEQVPPLPIDCLDTEFYNFILEADATALQALLDRDLNGPAGGAVRYVPVVGHVLLGYANVRHGTSVTMPLGYLQEYDTSFSVPVARLSRSGDVESVGIYQPYLFVSNGMAMAAGREIYGFPKELGEVCFPTAFDDPGPYPVRTMVLPELGSNVQQVMRQVLSVQRQPGASTGEELLLTEALDLSSGTLEIIEGLLKGGLRHTPWQDLEIVWKTLKLLLHGSQRFVFLKQFRDVVDSTKACYQAIIEADAKVLKLNQVRLLDAKRYQAQVDSFPSHPISTDLGLLAGGKTAPRMLAAFYVDFSFQLQSGTEVWKAT